jgi:peptidoglycan/LPS O-acetylase OafA/YrhL
MGYRADIDGLRAVAVTGVILFHAFPGGFPGGFVGVDVFFVISGFLITGVIVAEGPGGFSFFEFYSRRIRRIFPSLIVVLFATFVIGWFELYSGEFLELGRQIVASAAFVANFLFWRESGYFDTDASLKPLLHLWSLGVEEQFYLLWPAAIYLGWKRGIRPLYVVLLVALLSFALNVVEVRHNPAAAFYSPLTRFWELMIGAALAVEKVNFSQGAARHIGSVAGLAMIALSFFVIAPGDGFPGWLALLPVIGSALAIAAGPSGAANRILAWRPLVGIGLISYPLYLWHWPLLVFARIGSLGTDPIGLRLVVILISFVLAAATFALVERPIRLHATLAPAAATLVALMVLTGSAGLLARVERGFPDRAGNSHIMDRAVPPAVQNGSCVRLFGLTMLDNEACIANSARPGVLFLGDSQAIVLNSAVWAGMVETKTAMIAGSSCLPFLHYTTRYRTQRDATQNCSQIAAQALEFVESAPSINTVVLASVGSNYFSGEIEGFGIYDERDGALAADQAGAFVDGYSDLVSRLIAAGKKVVFFTDVPELGFEPAQCTRRAVALAERHCVLARSKVDDRQHRYRALVTQIADRNPALKVFDSTPVFCDQERCRWILDGRSLYYDPNHLSVDGSLLALKAFAITQ